MPRKVNIKSHQDRPAPDSPTVPKKWVTVFTKTPLEHAETYRLPSVYGSWKTRWSFYVATKWIGSDTLPWQVLPAPPPGYIRVKWYSEFERLDCRSGELEANFPLESNGDLNLTRVQNAWGMDKCVPINPWRMKRFEPSRPDILTAVAIHCLKDPEGSIRLIEEPSPKVQKIRDARWGVINFFRDGRDAPYAITFLLIFYLSLLYWWYRSIFRPLLPEYLSWLGLPV